MKATIEALLENPVLLKEEGNSANVSDIFIEELISGVIDEYFDILNKYIKAKKDLEMLNSDISKNSGLPDITIRKCENLQTIPRVFTLIKLLHSVGLKLTTEPYTIRP